MTEEEKEKKKKTMIDIHFSTRDRIKETGKMGDSYDDAINRLIDFWKKHH